MKRRQWETADCLPAAERKAVWEMESLALHLWAEERRNCLLLSHRIGILERIVAELEHTLQGHELLAAVPPGDPRLPHLRETAPDMKAADPSRSLSLTQPSLQSLNKHRQVIADSVALDVKAAAHRQAEASGKLRALAGEMVKAVAVEGIAAAHRQDEASDKLRALAGGAARNQAMAEYRSEELQTIAQAQDVD